MKVEGLAAPLFFSALALAAWGSAKASPALWLLSLLVLALGARLLSSTDPNPGASALQWCVAAFAVWMVATNLWANPSYNASAPFHAAFLVGGFMLGRRAAAAAAPMLFIVALTFALGLALWALWEWSTLRATRAHAVFITPAALGAATNLVLVPAMAMFVLDRRRRGHLLPCVLLLIAALAVAQSRGAWIALGAALIVGAIAAWRHGLAFSRGRAVVVLAVLAVGAAASWLIGNTVVDATGIARPLTETVAVSHRAELYQLALRELARSSWLFGSGYQSFYYLLEASRPIPGFVENSTYFVHNDYLQAFLELGAPGAAGLLGLAVLPLIHGWRAERGSLAEGDAILLVCLVGATSSMAVHALGDFPFYIPACVLMYGTALGILDTLLLEARGMRSQSASQHSSVARRAFRAGAATLAGWLLVTPVAAEAAAEYGMQGWQAGRAGQAAWGFETARRVDPKDWRYHWYAGQFWMAQAGNQRDRAAAMLADRALADGIASNPREVRPLLDRLLLHSRMRELLTNPASSPILIEWAERASRLAPADALVRSHRDAVVRRFGAGGKP